jgi:hypothetical protein
MHVDDMDIRILADSYGGKNLTFFLPARPTGVTLEDFGASETAKIVKAYRADEGQYPLVEGYKVVLECVEPGYAVEEFYQTDFQALARVVPEYYVKVGEQLFRFGFRERAGTS